MYSVQDERLDPLKGKSSSVYIFESDNDFFFGVLFKQINNSVSPFRFFFLLLLLCRGAVCRYNVNVYVCAGVYLLFLSWLHMDSTLSLLREYYV